MQKNKTIIIVGGGISGLSAGIYAEQNGLHAVILEKNPTVGGFCTGWYRDGKYIDGCLHWLTGTKHGTDLYDIWTSIHAIESDDDIVYLDTWGSFEYEGTTVTFYTDIDKTEKELLEISPKDKRMIKKFTKYVRNVASVDEPLSCPPSMMPLKKLIKYGWSVFKVWPSYLLTMKRSCEKFANKFKHPAIRWAMKRLQPGDGNLFCMLFSYATLVKGNGGLPVGGSQRMVERIKNYFISLGGTLKVNTEVDKILIKSKKACGVILKNGDIMESDYVISALDAHYAITKLLDNKYYIDSIAIGVKNYKKHPCPTACLLSFSIKDIPDINIPHSFSVEPFVVGASTIDHLTIRSYKYDSNFIYGDETVVTMLIDQYGEDYNTWAKYHDDMKLYRAKKKELGEEVIKRLEKQYPSLIGKIKLLDIATPVTFNRYTNATRGAYMSFLQTPKTSIYMGTGKLVSLSNFYLAGQWMFTPGGLPMAVSTGRFAVQRILEIEKREAIFKPSKVKAQNK